MKKSKNIAFIDTLKAIGIILVVIGHNDTILTKYIYSFHMPLFFFLSGITFNDAWNNKQQSPQHDIQSHQYLRTPNACIIQKSLKQILNLTFLSRTYKREINDCISEGYRHQQHLQNITEKAQRNMIDFFKNAKCGRYSSINQQVEQSHHHGTAPISIQGLTGSCS